MPGYIKPMRLGVLTKCTPYAGGAIFTVTALGFFDLLEPDYLLIEMGLWATAAEQLPPGSVLDFGAPKPNGELIVAGSAIPPGGQPVDKLLVEASVGPISKQILAVGNRHWVHGDHGPVFTDPVPFTHIPLVPELAYGGPDHKENPAGRGVGARALLEAGHWAPLPNLEDPRRPILHVDDAPPPAWFGPYPLDAPWRNQYLGTFDKRYMKTHFPGYPEDFDTRYFLTAPDDQQLHGFFQGDERVVVAGMSSSHPRVETRLPSIRARAFVQRTSEPVGLQELKMRLDTVWLFGSVNKGLVAFRGSTMIQDIEGDDVADVMIAYERMSDEPRPESHYAEVYRLRRDPDEKLKYLLADYQLAPEIDPAIKEARRVRKLAEFQERARAFAASQEFALKKEYETHNVPMTLLPKIPVPQIPPIAIPTEEEIERGEADFAALLDDLEEQEKFAETVMAELEATSKDIAENSGLPKMKGLPEFEDLAPDPKYAGAVEKVQVEAIDPGSVLAQLDTFMETMPDISSRPVEQQEQVHSAMDAIRGLISGAVFEDSDNFRPEEEEFTDARARALDLPEGKPFHQAREQLKQVKAQLDRTDLSEVLSEPQASAPSDKVSDLLNDIGKLNADPATIEAGRQRLLEGEAKLAELLPSMRSDTPGGGFDQLLSDIAAHTAATPPNDPNDMVRELEAMLDNMEPFATKGVRDCRLISLQPVIQPLRPSVSKRLGRLVLDEIGRNNLAGRDLAFADLEGADLSGADLTETLLEGANLKGANLAGVRADKATFSGADLTGTDFSGADLNKVNFASATLTNTNFAGARLADPGFLMAELSGLNFHGAEIVRCQALNQNLDRCDFSEATLSECTFIDSTFGRALFRRARLSKTVFINGHAEEVDFVYARLENVGFINLSLERAVFSDADIRESGFVGGVSLQGSSFDGARGLKSSWFGTDLRESCFLRGHFRECNFMMSDARHCDFRLVVLRDTLMMRADFSGSDFFGASLHGAQLRKADLSHASLRQANAYGADFSLAKLTGTDLHDAHLVQTLFRAPETVS